MKHYSLKDLHKEFNTDSKCLQAMFDYRYGKSWVCPKCQKTGKFYLIESQWKIEQAHQNGEPYTRMKFEADASKVEDKLQHFFATALEEEREKFITQLMVWTYTETLSREQLRHKGCGNHNGNNECCRNETLELVRQRINQLKEA